MIITIDSSHSVDSGKNVQQCEQSSSLRMLYMLQDWVLYTKPTITCKLASDDVMFRQYAMHLVYLVVVGNLAAPAWTQVING